MLHTILLDDSTPKAKALLAFLKSLEFVKISQNEIPNWQKEQLDIALDEHKNGTVLYKDWDEIQEQLSSKYNLE